MPLGGARERERERESREGSDEVIVCSLPVLCLFSVWCLSVSCFRFSVRCSLLINRSQLSSARVNCIPKVGGLRSPEASKFLGPSLMLKLLVTDLWTLLWNIKFIHPMWESSGLLILLTCSALHVKSHLSHQHILNQLETAVLDSTHSMYQLEIQDEVQF